MPKKTPKNQSPYKPVSAGHKQCKDCLILKKEGDFYYYKNKNNGRSNTCKTCLTKNIVNSDESTYLPKLKELGYPYVPDEWQNCITRTTFRDPNKAIGGQIVFGKYLTSMQTKQFKEFDFEHSEDAIKAYNAMPDHNISVSVSDEAKKIMKAPRATFLSANNLDLSDQLTEDDKVKLLSKWGSTYTPNEWIQLEKHYCEMEESFPIEDAGRKYDLIMACLSYMKAFQALEAQDIKTFKELMGVYSNQMKNGKFTAAQNKENNNEQINSACELVLMCERDGGFIPKFCTDIPQDKVDLTINNMNQYVQNLVTDLGFGKALENAIKKIEKDMEKKNPTKKTKAEEKELDQMIEDKRRELFESVQKRINEEAQELEELESDDFLKEFCKEEGDDKPAFIFNEEEGDDI